MDYVQLRTLLEPLITGLKDSITHAMLSAFCEEMGLPAPTEDGVRQRFETNLDFARSTGG